MIDIDQPTLEDGEFVLCRSGVPPGTTSPSSSVLVVMPRSEHARPAAVRMLMIDSTMGRVWLRGFGIASRVPRERRPPEPPDFITVTLARFVAIVEFTHRHRRCHFGDVAMALPSARSGL